MNSFFQKLNKTSGKFYVLVYLMFSIALPLFLLLLNIEINSFVSIILVVLNVFFFILLVKRFLYYLKSIGSIWHDIFKLFIIFLLFCISSGIIIILDAMFGFRGLLKIPVLALEVLLFMYILIRHFMRRWENTHFAREETSGSYPFEQLCIDLEDGCEIEFTYANCRYLFIPENGWYYFKRIVAIDPYEYEILAEAGNAFVCIDASSINGKKISGLWPDVEDITVY